jgi:hypothetical protein
MPLQGSTKIIGHSKGSNFLNRQIWTSKYAYCFVILNSCYRYLAKTFPWCTLSQTNVYDNNHMLSFLKQKNFNKCTFRNESMKLKKGYKLTVEFRYFVSAEIGGSIAYEQHFYQRPHLRTPEPRTQAPNLYNKCGGGWGGINPKVYKYKFASSRFYYIFLDFVFKIHDHIQYLEKRLHILADILAMGSCVWWCCHHVTFII